jgi:hypothetical protein
MSLVFVAFEVNSRLFRLERENCRLKGLHSTSSIAIPSLIEVIGEYCRIFCREFETGVVEKGAFCESGLQWIAMD